MGSAQPIGALVSSFFYNHTVKNDERRPGNRTSSTIEKLATIDMPLSTISLVDNQHVSGNEFLNVEERNLDGRGYRNDFEAEVIVDMVSSWTSAKARHRGFGILKPYDAQKNNIASLLQRRGLCQSKIEVITFDSLQGKEYDVAVFSLVRAMLTHTEGSVRPNLLQFYENKNAACVVFSRAQEALVVIGKCENIAQASLSWKNSCQPYGEDQRKETKSKPMSNRSSRGLRTQRTVFNFHLSKSNLLRHILNRLVFTMEINCTELHRAAALRGLLPVDLPRGKMHSALDEAPGCVKNPGVERAGGLRRVRNTGGPAWSALL